MLLKKFEKYSSRELQGPKSKKFKITMPIERNYFDVLPHEICLKILGYLSTIDILKKISLVSRRFNNLSKAPCLVKRVKLFNITDYDYEHAASFFSNSKSLHELCVTYRKFNDGSDMEKFDNYASLMKISLQNSFNSLRVLKVRDMATHFDDICKYIHNFGQNIEHLELRLPITFEDNRTYKGVDYLCQMKNLKYFRLKRANLSLENIVSLAENSPNLKAIDICFDGSIYSVNETSTAFECFFEKVKLTLKSFKCTFRGTQDIVQSIRFLHYCQSLEDVTINDHTKNVPVSNYFNYLATLTNLTSLRSRQVNGNRNLDDLEECLVKIDTNQMTELHLYLWDMTYHYQSFINIMERKWPALKVFRLSTHEGGFLSKFEKLVNVILEQCPMLEVLILPWNDFRTNFSDEFIYKLLTERKLKLFINYLRDDTSIIKRMKKYEVHHVPSKQRIFDDVNLNDILRTNKNSAMVNQLLYVDRDIFGELTCRDFESG